MSKSFIYSYRLTYFGGTAPCYDGNYLSLAICKRDMRRVIGYKFSAVKENNLKDSIWIVGIVGKALEKSNNDFTREDIIYIAKITSVKTFCEYFSDIKNARTDKIYIPDTNGQYQNQGKFFSPKANNNVHDDKFLWDRDWDEQHRNKEKFVLISQEYAFVNKEQSNIIKTEIGKNANYKLAKGVGHTWFECDNNSNIVTLFEDIIGSAKNHNKNTLPTSVRNCAYSGCGKDHAI